MNSAKDQVAPLIWGYSDLIEADAAMIALFGGGKPYIRKRSSVQAIEVVPGIYWSIVSQIPGEHLWSALVDWDVWTKTYAQAVLISDRLAAIMHRTLPVTVNGVFLWSQLESVVEGPEIGGGDTRRINTYRYQPVRAGATSGA